MKSAAGWEGSVSKCSEREATKKSVDADAKRKLKSEARDETVDLAAQLPAPAAKADVAAAKEAPTNYLASKDQGLLLGGARADAQP